MQKTFWDIKFPILKYFLGGLLEVELPRRWVFFFSSLKTFQTYHQIASKKVIAIDALTNSV